MFFLCIIYLNREPGQSSKFVDIYAFIYFELKNEINLRHFFFFLFSSHASFFFVSCGHAYLSSFVFFSFPSFIGFYSVRLDWIWLLKIKIQFFFFDNNIICMFIFFSLFKIFLFYCMKLWCVLFIDIDNNLFIYWIL